MADGDVLTSERMLCEELDEIERREARRPPVERQAIPRSLDARPAVAATCKA